MTPTSSKPPTTRRHAIRYLCGTCALAEARVHRWVGPWWGLLHDDPRPPCTCGATSSVATTTPQPQHVREGT